MSVNTLDVAPNAAMVLTTAKKIPRERLAMTERLYLAGRPRSSITSMLCKKYGIAARTARKYVALVEEKLAAIPKPAPEATFQLIQAMLLETYQKARAGVKYVTFVEGVGAATSKITKAVPAPEVGTMATVAVRLAELHGIGGAQKIDLTSGGKPVVPVAIYIPMEKEP